MLVYATVSQNVIQELQRDSNIFLSSVKKLEIIWVMAAYL